MSIENIQHAKISVEHMMQNRRIYIFHYHLQKRTYILRICIDPLREVKGTLVYTVFGYNLYSSVESGHYAYSMSNSNSET